MKKIILGAIVLGLFTTTGYAKKVEQTICFSKSDCSNRYSPGSVGDTVNLCSGKCQGKTLQQMNKEGWKLTEVIGGLSSSFGMVFTKEK